MTQTPTRKAVGRASNLALKHVFIGPWLRLFLKGDISNIDVLKTVDGAVIASNHQAFVEHLLLPLYSSRPVQFWAKSDWWGMPGVRGKVNDLFFTLTNQVPVDRSGGNGAQNAFDAAVHAVRSGNLFCIYPEGTRSPDGRVYRGRTGAARVAAAAGVPIIPCAVTGTRDLQPVGRFMPKPGRFGMHFGEPVYLSQDATDEEIRSVTDHVMQRIVELGNLDYVDEYARKR